MGRSGTKTRFYLKTVLDIVGSDPYSSVVEALRSLVANHGLGGLEIVALSLIQSPLPWRSTQRLRR